MCPSLINTAQYKIREYPLDVEGKSKEELEKFSLQLNNAYIAQEKIGSSPFIVKTEYRTNEENTYYYEISRYQDERLAKGKTAYQDLQAIWTRLTLSLM